MGGTFQGFISADHQRASYGHGCSVIASQIHELLHSTTNRIEIMQATESLESEGLDLRAATPLLAELSSYTSANLVFEICYRWLDEAVISIRDNEWCDIT